MGSAAGAPRALVHLELHTPALARGLAELRELCGWHAMPVAWANGAYIELGPGRGAVGCAAPRPLWLPYVEVPDVRGTLAAALALGGRALLGPREGPAGWRCVVALPGAGELALWQPKEPGERAQPATLAGASTSSASLSDPPVPSG